MGGGCHDPWEEVVTSFNSTCLSVARMKLAWQSKEVGKPRWIVTSTAPDSKVALVTSALEKQVPSTGIFSEPGVAVNLYLW